MRLLRWLRTEWWHWRCGRELANRGQMLAPPIYRCLAGRDDTCPYLEPGRRLQAEQRELIDRLRGDG